MPERASSRSLEGAARRPAVKPRDRLIVALDAPSRTEARRLVRELRGSVGFFKVGLQLYTAEGPAAVREIVRAGERVFLDLKLHDIPNTVGAAVTEATRLGVSFLTLHTAGGEAMLRAAVEAARRAERRPSLRPRLLGVTVLTSLDSAAVRSVGFRQSPLRLAVHLAGLAQRCGLGGVVASGREVAAIKRACGPGFLTVVPGIRPAGTELGDQRRATTPAEAVLAGADHLVVGRPITAARDPGAAAEAIVAEIGG
jgi:orotidine-5'-phosphate decarboxylase